MKTFWVLISLFCAALFSVAAQDGYVIKPGDEDETIRFKFVNNLIIVPVEVNGKELSFILDTGVSVPILFNITDKDSLSMGSFEEIELKGLGEGEPIRAIRSRHNRFKLKNIYNNDQEFYMLLNREINFSPRLGITVHGIIGYDLLKNFIVEINYRKKKLKFNNPEAYRYRKCGACETYRLDLIGNKPFLNASVALGGNEDLPVYLLLDSGSTDAVWLFEDDDEGIHVPELYFEDYMGKGLSGNIYGKRSRLEKFSIGKFMLKDAKVAFPDSVSTKHITFRGNRDGSLGSEILKRFDIVIDYPYERITLRKNGNFNDPFKYNMSGIELQHNGVRIVKELEKRAAAGVTVDDGDDSNSAGVTFTLGDSYSISLEPALEIAEIREGSPAMQVGLKKGDVILSVNGRPAHRYNIQQLSEIINEKAGKKIKLLIDRNGTELKFAFELVKVL
ncbi:aspartyl protease family protein [Robertkochia solimangrovi]|uniref:aspartyl protease family protein n=1 Tax=Robertkochia solimangrovi TaxID=2213046 RepID=UPI001180B587|nr:aspartyl protease family protein [Robertkochia solimangrovi]TRZ41445.1 aspartate aminotransferase [Robertkochia solimangrovi]